MRGGGALEERLSHMCHAAGLERRITGSAILLRGVG